MEQVFETARRLAEQIRGAEAACEYLEARAVIDDRPDLQRLFLEYHRRMHEMMEAEAAGGDDIMRRRERVSEAYSAAAAEPELARFIGAERDAVALVCDVLDIVASGVEIETEPLNGKWGSRENVI